MDLQEIRGQLDEIDAQVVELLKKRLRLGEEVARYKMQAGKPVLDRERERRKLEAIGQMTDNEFDRHAMEETFTQQMTISRRLQYQILKENGKTPDTGFSMAEELKKDGVRVVYQGVEGAYSHIAALEYFGEQGDLYHVRTWQDAMDAVERGEADYAVIPIENSSAGAVSDNYDLLVAHDNVIVGEIFLPVRHGLLGLPGASEADIRVVYSHPPGPDAVFPLFKQPPPVEADQRGKHGGGS